MPHIYTDPKSGEQFEIVGLGAALRNELSRMEPYCFDNPEETSMQKYKCHKEVKAMKIETMEIWRDGSATLYAEGSCNGVSVKSEWMERNNPKPGGYYVNYMQDGYSSYSPEDAFEEGYTLITETEAA